jgi:hypothetical protein
MALVIYAPLVTAIKGSIGGVTFQANAAGQIVRQRARPKRSRTLKQHLTQPLLLGFLKEWRTLDLATQTLWNDYALAHPHTDFYGRVRYLTGFNWFARINSQRFRVYYGWLYTPPAWDPPAPLNSISLLLNAAYLNIYIDPTPLPADITVVMYFTPPLWRSQTPFRQHMRYIFAAPYPPSPPYDVSTYWSGVFQLPWPPPGTDGMTIQAGVYPVNVTNGLTAAASFANAQLPPP